MKVMLGGYGRILVKFMFTNPKLIPAGIPQQPVGSNLERDHLHRLEALLGGWREKADFGRVREGRVDTGENFINGMPSVTLGSGLGQLAAAGWKGIVSPHWFVQTPRADGNRQRQPKNVLVLDLMREADCEGEWYDLPDEARPGIQFLAHECNWMLHGWANPNGVITLNAVMRQDGVGANTLMIREDEILAVPVSETARVAC